MSATVLDAGQVAEPRPRGKVDLWIAWWVVPIFYNLFGLIFVPLTRVMPPPRPDRTPAQIGEFFADHRVTIQIGFALLMVVVGGSCVSNGLVALQMKRMSVSPAYAYAYIGTLAVGVVPGCLFAAFAFLAATFRPDRDPQIVALLYDVGLMSFVGSLGCFSAQYLVLAIAILCDRNNIFPTWMAYLSLWQIVTELIAALLFVFYDGPFAWDGSISFYLGTVIFAVYQVCFIILIRAAIKRSPLGEKVPD